MQVGVPVEVQVEVGEVGASRSTSRSRRGGGGGGGGGEEEEEEGGRRKRNLRTQTRVSGNIKTLIPGSRFSNPAPGYNF